MGCGQAGVLEGVSSPSGIPKAAGTGAHRILGGRSCQALGKAESEGASLSSPVFLLQVGFLKILHRYEITFTLPPVLRLSKDVREAPVPSLHLRLLSVLPIPEGVSPAQGAGGLLSSSGAWVGVGVSAWGASSPPSRVDGQFRSWGT